MQSGQLSEFKRQQTQLIDGLITDVLSRIPSDAYDVATNEDNTYRLVWIHDERFIEENAVIARLLDIKQRMQTL